MYYVICKTITEKHVIGLKDLSWPMDSLFRPTASDPINLLHLKQDKEDRLWVQHECGKNPPESLTMEIGEFKFQKYRAKHSLEPYIGYNWQKDLPKSKDSFLRSMKPGEEVKLTKQVHEYWEKI